ncbi:ScyD/ScyE family protein [Streptomyces sp. B-S-A8]|uniref:ScyD/ScyE family protein n=1 Tax=Streptomyces solicavernae TaxID=3043614 RepID=A0ABT6S0A8_9ACTN|nr:ScyD/ScyE family protein [Streptomyces sp. B-S-A8]MDI3389859.1 ScyD/ScyE family protein [Streptomyces sp. B-S-A8]
MSKISKSWAGAFLAAAVAGGLTVIPTLSQAAPQDAVKVEAVASGLKNPRDVAIQSDGSILIAESGSGPADACTEPGSQCLGFTGSVYRIKGSDKGRVVTGLPSKRIVRADGSSVIAGANDVQSAGGGRYRVTYSLSGTAANRKELGAGAEPLGTLAIAKGKVLGDLTVHESSNNPDGGEVLSNPQRAVTVGSDHLVVDAAANTLLRVASNGTVKTEFVFPKNGSSEAVPTSIVKGSGGAYYISDMSGIGKGLSRVWRWEPGSDPTVFTTGMTGVIDLAVQPDGNLVALSYATGDSVSQPNTGALTRIDKSTGALTPIDAGTTLNLPTGLDIASSGELYVTNNTLSDNGELLKIPAP